MRDQEVKEKIAKFFEDTSPKPTKSNKSKFYILTIVALLLIFLAWIIYSEFFVPIGKITSPSPGSSTSRLVVLEGYTKNIPHENRFLWLVVNVDSLNLCWPKRPIPKANGLFKIQIYEAGPNTEFSVSLYALDQYYNDLVLQ